MSVNCPSSYIVLSCLRILQAWKGSMVSLAVSEDGIPFGVGEDLLKSRRKIAQPQEVRSQFTASWGFPPPTPQPLTQTSVCRHRTADIGSGSRELNKGEQVPRPARSSGARRARTAALAEGACEASQPSRRCAGTRLRAERRTGASRGQSDRGPLPGHPSTASRVAGTQTPHLRGRAAHRPPPHSSSPPRPPSLHPSLPP